MGFVSSIAYMLTTFDLYSSRVTAAAVNPTCKQVAVGNSVGKVKVLNFRSGGVLYDLPHQEKEVTCLKFMSESKSFDD